MAEVSKDEIVEIVTSFLLNSPPGEFMEVVTDIRGLLEDDSILNESAPNTFREYNTDQMVPVQVPGQTHEALITKDGEVKPGEYVDPRSKQVILFDHIRNEVTGSRPAAAAEIDASVESFRDAVDKAMQQYQADHYKTGATSVFGKQEGGKNVIVVCVSSSKFNPRNYWNGRFRSRWVCSFANNGEVTLTGLVRINVHYYEDGNVQLLSSTPVAAKCPGGDAKKTAEEIVKAIKKAESTFSSELDAMYNTMGDTTFKALRRALPITRTKIDWEKIRNFKSVVAGK